MVNLKTKVDGRHKLVLDADDDDNHVGTVWEGASAKEVKAAGQSGGGGFFNWYTRNNGGRASSEEEALAKIREELER